MAQIVTAAHRDLYSYMLRPTDEPSSHSDQNEVSLMSDVLYG